MTEEKNTTEEARNDSETKSPEEAKTAEEGQVAPLKTDKYFYEDDPTEELEIEKKGQFVNEFFGTIMRILFSPLEFYASIVPEGKLSVPFLFAAVSALFFYVGDILTRRESLAALVTGPIFAPLVVLIIAYCCHIVFVAFPFRSRSSSAIIRIVAYSHAASLVGVIPFIGSTVASYWGLALTVIGVKVVYRTTWVSAIFAVFLPYLALASLLVLIAFSAKGA